MGTVRLKEHPQFTSELDLSGFASALVELFPTD
jgi:hypothetical protein